MKFTKMQGLGNDYVYVNCLKEKIDNPPAVARFVSDRHFGIGADGLIMFQRRDVWQWYSLRGKICLRLRS